MLDINPDLSNLHSFLRPLHYVSRPVSIYVCPSMHENEFASFVCHQMARTVLQAQQAAKLEQRHFDELSEWLVHAEDTLRIVDLPVNDLQQEYKVSTTLNHLL